MRIQPKIKWIPVLTAAAALALAAQSTESIRPAGSMELAGVLHHERALAGAHDVQLQGNYAYVAGKGGSVAIVDVSDAQHPRLVSFLYDPVALEDAETVLPMGDVLLVGTRDLVAIDIRNPAQPKILKTIADRPRIDAINGMALRGNHVLAANKRGTIVVFDVTNPASPVYVGARVTASDGAISPHDIGVSGDHAVIVDVAPNRPSNVYIYRVADAVTHQLLPPEKWTVEGKLPNKSGQKMDGANRVALWGDYGAAGAFGPDWVGIFDRSKPAEPRIISTLPVCDIDATGMTLAGRILFVAGGECAEAIDISNPALPVSLAQYRGGRLFPSRRVMRKDGPRFDNGHDLVYRDGYLDVTAQNDHNLGILKILDQKILELAREQKRTQ
jgi:hypothetical protein